METIDVVVEKTIQDYTYEPFKVSVKRSFQIEGDEATKMNESGRIARNLERMVDDMVEKRMARREAFAPKQEVTTNG